MTSNYNDKSIDVVAFHGVQPAGYAQLRQNLFLGTSGEVCTGIQKLVQRWLCIFLTPIGSQTFSPDRGTRFMIDIFTASTETRIQTIFQSANSDALSQLRGEETVGMPEDERIKSVKLDKMSLYLGRLSLYISIKSVAGTSASIILPIDTNPLML